jgi:5'-3' exonuclease
MLTIEGITAASFSTDTDNLTYGCPLVITGFNGSGGVSVISINDVLACLDMSYREFVDLCIMAGCDYNDNIPKIGIGKSHKLLKEYHSIDNITKYDVQCLKHIKCRQLFAYVHSGLLIVSGYLDVNKNALMNTARDVLTNFHLDNYMERLVKLYQQLSQPVNNLPQPPTKPRLNIV